MGSPAATARSMMAAALGQQGQQQQASLYGAMSPLVQSYSENIYGRTASNLPRPPEEFTLGAFGPGMPLYPIPIDQPEEDGTIRPRRTQGPISWNLPTGTPGDEGLGKLASFGTLRAMADKHNVTRRCIEARKAEIIGLEWDIVPTPIAEKSMEGSSSARADWQKRKAEVMAFFQRPDRSPDSPWKDWAEWMYALLEDLFVIDAVALFHHAPRQGTGWFGSHLASLDLIDGSTIRPLYDIRYGVPSAGTPAYSQYLWGVPRSDYSVMTEGKDQEEIGHYFVRNFTMSEMSYYHMVNRTWAPYGFSPVEQSLLPIAIHYARENSQLQWFTEGSSPYTYIIPGPELITSPQQVRQLQSALNNISGDQGWKWKTVVLPPGSKSEAMKPPPLADQFDEFIVSLCAMQWGMSASDLGIFPAVAPTQSASQVKLMSQVQTQNASSRWLEPVTNRLADIHQGIISYVFKQNDMLFQWSGLEQPQDLADKISSAIELVKGSIKSIDEGRQDIGLEPLGLPETSVPLIFTGTGAVPVSLSVAQAMAVLGQHPAPVFPGAPGKPGGDNQLGIPTGANASRTESPLGTATTGPQAPGITADPSGLTTPMHEAAAAVAQGSKPSAQPTSKMKSELEILDRFLEKGKPLVDFVPKTLSQGVMGVVAQTLPQGRTAAVEAGRAEVMREYGRRTRDQAVRQIETEFAKPLGMALRRIGMVGVADEAVPDVQRSKLQILQALMDAKRVAGASAGLKSVPEPQKSTVDALVKAGATGIGLNDAILAAFDEIEACWPVFEWETPEIDVFKLEHGPEVVANPHPYTERHLIKYFLEGAGGRIKWGFPGDYDTCVSIAGKYIPDKVHGFCQHLHYMATGKPAGHAPAEEAMRGKTAEFYELAMKGGVATLNSGKRIAAGLAVRAKNTGRVLLQQRTDDPSRPAPGKWEFPGGEVDKGDDTLLATAKREWEEEVGSVVPEGTIVGSWTSPDGQYEGFVLEVANEEAVTGQGDEHEHTQGVKWMDPQEAKSMPDLREECKLVPWGMIGA